MAKKKKITKSAAKVLSTNANINVSMQPAMVKILDRLMKHLGCSTKAEMIRHLIREESARQGIPLGGARRKKG
jgi:hypothetical protein